MLYVVAALALTALNPNHPVKDSVKVPVHAIRAATSAKNTQRGTVKVEIAAISDAMVNAVCGDVTTGALLRSTSNATIGDDLPSSLVGTARCMDTTTGTSEPVLGCFPGWTGGHEGNTGYCKDTPLPSCGSTSNWWVTCPQIERVDHTRPCGGAFAVGDAVIAAVANPSSAVGLPKGAVGQVFCLGKVAPTIGVNWGGLYTKGHSGNPSFCEESPLPRSGPLSSWYVSCSEVTPLANTTAGPPTPTSCPTATNSTQCHAVSGGECKWCVSKDKAHSLCFAADKVPAPSAWDCA